MGARNFEQWEYDKMESMHSQGILWEDIANELGRNKQTIRKKLYSMGFKPNKNLISYAHNNIDINWAKETMETNEKNHCNKDFIYYVMRGSKYNNRIDWINFSTLSIDDKGIDWENIKGHEISVYYNNVNYKLTITSNKNDKRQINILLNGVEGTISDTNIKKIKLSSYVTNQKVTYKYKHDVDDVVSYDNSNFKILEQRQFKSSEDSKTKTGYLVKCITCGYIHEKRQSSLDLKRSCAVCSNRIVVEGINNASYIYPYIEKYLVNKEDGKTLSIFDAHNPITTKCPNCNYVNNKNRMVYLCKGFKCTQCMTGSRGERIISNMLRNGQYKYDPQFIINDYRYDYHIPSLNLLFEVDGEQHRNEVKHFKISLAEQQQIDIEKEKLALSLGYNFKRVEIDTYESIESIVNKMDFIEFDKSNIYDYLTDNELLEFVELYNSNTPMKDIKNIMKKSKQRITYLAKLSASLNLIEYNKEDSKYRHSVRKVMCLNDNRVFNTIKDAEEYYNCYNVGKVCSGVYTSTKGLKFKYVD